MDLFPGAVIRNLGKLSKLGIQDSVGADSKDFWVRIVEVRLKDDVALARAKIHPLTLLIAFKQYNKGSSLKGKLEWDVNSRISKALLFVKRITSTFSILTVDNTIKAAASLAFIEDPHVNFCISSPVEIAIKHLFSNGSRISVFL
jgi:hypothetical protein